MDNYAYDIRAVKRRNKEATANARKPGAAQTADDDSESDVDLEAAAMRPIDCEHGRVLVHASDGSAAHYSLVLGFLVSRRKLTPKQAIMRLESSLSDSPSFEWIEDLLDSLYEGILQRELARRNKRFRELRMASLAGL